MRAQGIVRTLAATLLLCPAGFVSGALAGEPIKLGLIAPMSGVSSHYGPILKNSAELALALLSG